MKKESVPAMSYLAGIPPFRIVIYLHRQELDLSRQKYAEKYGLTYQTVRNWELGFTEPSGAALFDAMVDYLPLPLKAVGDVSAKDMIEGVDREIRKEKDEVR